LTVWPGCQSGDPTLADAILDRLRGFVESNTDANVVGWTSEKLDFDETATL